MKNFLLITVFSSLVQLICYSQDNTAKWSAVYRTEKGALTEEIIGETETHIFTLSKNEGLSQVVIYAHDKVTMAVSSVFKHKKSDLRGEQFFKAFVKNDRIYLFTQQLTAMTRDLYVEVFTTSLSRISDKKRIKRLEYASPKSPDYLSEFVLLENKSIPDHFILCNSRKNAKDKVELVYSLYDSDCNPGESGSFETHLEYKTSGLGGTEFDLLEDGTIVAKTKVLWTYKDDFSSSRSTGNMITLYNIYSDDRVEYSFNSKGKNFYNSVVTLKNGTIVLVGFYTTSSLSGDDPVGIYRVKVDASEIQEEDIEYFPISYSSAYLQKQEKGVRRGIMAETALLDDDNLIIFGSEFSIKESGGTIEWSKKKDLIIIQLKEKGEIDWSTTISRSESTYQHPQKDVTVLMKNDQLHILYADGSDYSQLNNDNIKIIDEKAIRYTVLNKSGELHKTEWNTDSPGWDDLKNTKFVPYVLNGQFGLLKESARIRFALPMTLFVAGAAGGFAFAPLYVLTIPAFILGFNSNYVEYIHCQVGTFSPE